MATKILYVTKDATIWDDGAGRGVGLDPHNVVGVVSTKELRVLANFDPHDLPSTTVLTKALLWLKRSANSASHPSSNSGATLIPGRITADWVAGNKGADHAYSLSNGVVYPGPTVTDELSARGSSASSAGTKWSLDVTPIVESWIGGASQKGIRLRRGSSDNSVFDSLESAGGKNSMYLELTYETGGTPGDGGNDPVNHPPEAPTMTLSLGADGKSLTVDMHYVDPDGDTATKYRIQIVAD